MILGGSFNDDNGLPYVGIFGNSINNPADIKPNTLHVNNLFASDASGTTNIYLVNLPTSMGAPGTGLLWNNGGVVNVS